MNTALSGNSIRSWPATRTVAIVDNEFTVKYLEREKEGFVLKPANKAYPVIRPKGRLEIFGVMAGLVRRTR